MAHVEADEVPVSQALYGNVDDTESGSDTNLSSGQENEVQEPFGRFSGGIKVNEAGNSLHARVPTYHASAQGPWCAVICYEACVRLCLNAWAKGFAEEASYFLNPECALLRKAFDLQNILLQPEEELLAQRSSSLVSERVTSRPKRTCGKIKVQVRKVRIGLEQCTGCKISNVNLSPYSGQRAARRVCSTPHSPLNVTFSQQSFAYMRASPSKYMKEVSGVFKTAMATVRRSPSTYGVVPETYSCLLRLKSAPEEDPVRMQPGLDENHVFFLGNHDDDLIIKVRDSNGQYCGRVLAKADHHNDKLRWWNIYHESKHEPVGKVQLYIQYSPTPDEKNNPKFGCVSEIVAYDFVLEVAMRVQNFHRTNLRLHGPWEWLVKEFASYYGVSDTYTKLRYLTYVMDVATPTKYCLDLVCDLLLPVITKDNKKIALSRLENRLLGDIEDQVQKIISLTFENYKSLDESAPSGMIDVFSPATRSAAPALVPAIQLYSLLHDISYPEAQIKFCKYFQAAARKRSEGHIRETNESISNNVVAMLDPTAFSKSYRKMTSLISSIKNEIRADIQINDHHVLPSFIDLPNLCASIYTIDLSNNLRSFLDACPPAGPTPAVTELVIATANFQRDLASWNINLGKFGFDAKELFHPYITLWIEGKRLALLELCKAEKVLWSGVRTTRFVDDMYEQLKQMLDEYEVIICQWPEYAVALETAIVDVEKAILEALDKQYNDVFATSTPKHFVLKYVRKLSKRTGEIYYVPYELGILLNSTERMLDVLRPPIETKLKSWISDDVGEYFSEITHVLRSNFRKYCHAVAEKLVENTKMERTTKLKKILKKSKETMVESDMQNKMQPLKDLLIKTIDHLRSIVEPRVFVDISRDVWDQMGKEILRVLQKGNKSRYKGSRFALSILDDIFVSKMEKLVGNVVQKKDLEPPTSIKEARSILC